MIFILELKNKKPTNSRKNDWQDYEVNCNIKHSDCLFGGIL